MASVFKLAACRLMSTDRTAVYILAAVFLSKLVYT